LKWQFGSRAWFPGIIKRSAAFKLRVAANPRHYGRLPCIGSKIYRISLDSLARLCDFSQAMKHSHSSSDFADQRDIFSSRGWLVLRNVVHRTDLEELNRAFDHVSWQRRT
jgi:hypothetical protein